jgi:sugar transferase (PEP-CTERM/EpsH1 system associated)
MDGTAATQPPLIVHVVVNLDVGGLENGLVNLVNRIPAERYRQAVVCLKSFTSFRDRITRSGVPVIALDKREGKDLKIYAKLWRLFRTLRPDIVHTRNLGTVDVAFPAKLAGVPVVVHGEHGWDVHDADGTNRKYRVLRRACAPLIDLQIAVSRHIASWLVDRVGVAASRVRQIYNGVDTSKFAPAAAGRRTRPPGADDGSFVIGTVGRMAAIKDPVTLVRAFRRLWDESGTERRRLRLVLVGDGPLREDVTRALGGSEAAEVAWLPGRRDDIPEILRGFDLFVLPSKNEGISNTILEAMATGLPVVATAVGGNPELVAAKRTGMLVPAEDEAALAAAMKGYLDEPARARVHGAAGRQRVLAEFSIDGMLSRYLESYDQVLGVKRPGGH